MLTFKILSRLIKRALNLNCRIQALLQWVHDSSRVAGHKMNPMGYTATGSGFSTGSSREYGLLMPSPSHLHCVAAILWHSYEMPVDYDLPALLNRELFESVSFHHVLRTMNKSIASQFPANHKTLSILTWVTLC